MSVEDRWLKRGTKLRTKDWGRGKRYRVRNPGTRTRSFDKKADAVAYDIEVRADLAKGLTPFDPTAGLITFGEYAATWMAERHYTGKGRPTVQSWLDNHILPTFGAKRLCDIHLSTIKGWWAGMRAKKYRGRFYSPSMLESVYVTLGSILRSAVIDKRIPEHPMDGWNPELPKRDKKARGIWEQDRVAAVVDGLSERFRGPGILSATCGLRQGESFGVALEDVNRFRHEITVRHQVLRQDGALVLAPPKGGKVRTVPLAAAALAAIDAHVKRYGTSKVRCSCCGRDCQVVFTRPDGGLIRPEEFRRSVWHPALVSAGLAPTNVNGQHNLRHAWASTLIDGNATPKEIQEWCGHESIKTTYDVYGHLFERSGTRARSIIDAAFSSRVYPERTAKIN